MSNIQKNEPQNLQVNNLQNMLGLATEMQRFCKEMNLTTEIQGKQYPNVEAWQYLGVNLGIMHRIVSVENTSTYELKTVKFYTKNGGSQTKEITCFSAVAKCELFNMHTGQIVGYGEAMCSNIEDKKIGFDEFAVFSIAQTRAISKAYRLSFGWIMKASGFEATPAEEMYEGKYDLPKTEKEPEIFPKKEATQESVKFGIYLKENITKEFFSEFEITNLRKKIKGYKEWDIAKIKKEFEAIKTKVNQRKAMTKEQKEFAQFLSENINKNLFNESELADLIAYFKGFEKWENAKFLQEYEKIKNDVADRKNWLMHQEIENQKQAQNG